MHTALIISAYLSMILAPCACAQWGDVLTAEWWHLYFAERRAVRRRAMSPAVILDPVLAAVRAEKVSIEIQTLAAAAFSDPSSMPRLEASSASRMTAHRLPHDQMSFERAAARVSARLAALSESYRLAHQPAPAPIEAEPEYVEAVAPQISNTSKPQFESTSEEMIAIPAVIIQTPTPEELEALYALEAPSEAVAQQGPPGPNDNETSSDTTSESIAA